MPRVRRGGVHDPLRLKALPKHPKAKNGPGLPIDFGNGYAAALRDQVVSFSAFAAGVAVEGCPHPRWHRPFFADFPLYGRLHAVGEGGHQNMKAADRLGLRIAGEGVAEIDIGSSCSHPHARPGRPAPCPRATSTRSPASRARWRRSA